MTFAAQGGLSLVGIPKQFVPTLSAASSTLIDATNEACVMYGQIITSDGSAHTLNTSGTIGLRFGAVTSANAGTTVKVGIGDLDAAAGPPARAVNVADVITFDCSKTLTGAGIITATAWTDFTPDTGSKVLTPGQIVAVSVQMTALGGADAFNVQMATPVATTGFPGATGFLAAAYTDQQRMPNVFITFADGAFAWLQGGYVFSTSNTNTTWNSGSATKEYGNILRFSYPQKAYGIGFTGAIGNNTDLVLYSVPLSGSPVAEKTVSMDQQQMAVATTGVHQRLFDTPYDIVAGVDYMVANKPTTATNNTMASMTFSNVNQQLTCQLGIGGYAANRASGAFAAQNSGLDRFAIGLFVSGGDTGGGSGGISRARAAGGF